MSTKANPATAKYVLCVNASGYPASLEIRKVYRALPDALGARRGFLRIVDESGDDYLYPTHLFVAIKLPRAAERVLATPGVLPRRRGSPGGRARLLNCWVADVLSFRPFRLSRVRLG